MINISVNTLIEIGNEQLNSIIVKVRHYYQSHGFWVSCYGSSPAPGAQFFPDVIKIRHIKRYDIHYRLNQWFNSQVTGALHKHARHFHASFHDFFVSFHSKMHHNGIRSRNCRTASCASKRMLFPDSKVGRIDLQWKKTGFFPEKESSCRNGGQSHFMGICCYSVSYTHLTLPTIYSV